MGNINKTSKIIPITSSTYSQSEDIEDISKSIEEDQFSNEEEDEDDEKIKDIGQDIKNKINEDYKSNEYHISTISNKNESVNNNNSSEIKVNYDWKPFIEYDEYIKRSSKKLSKDDSDENLNIDEEEINVPFAPKKNNIKLNKFSSSDIHYANIISNFCKGYLARKDFSNTVSTSFSTSSRYTPSFTPSKGKFMKNDSFGVSSFSNMLYFMEENTSTEVVLIPKTPRAI